MLPNPKEIFFCNTLYINIIIFFVYQMLTNGSAHTSLGTRTSLLKLPVGSALLGMSAPCDQCDILTCVPGVSVVQVTALHSLHLSFCSVSVDMWTLYVCVALTISITSKMALFRIQILTFPNDIYFRVQRKNPSPPPYECVVTLYPFNIKYGMPKDSAFCFLHLTVCTYYIQWVSLY